MGVVAMNQEQECSILKNELSKSGLIGYVGQMAVIENDYCGLVINAGFQVDLYILRFFD